MKNISETSKDVLKSILQKYVVDTFNDDALLAEYGSVEGEGQISKAFLDGMDELIDLWYNSKPDKKNKKLN